MWLKARYVRVGPSRRTPILLAICPVRSNLSPLPSNLHSPLPPPPLLLLLVLFTRICISQLTPSNLHLPQSCSPVYLNIPWHGYFAHDDWVLWGTRARSHVQTYPLPPSVSPPFNRGENLQVEEGYSRYEESISRMDSIFLHLHNPWIESLKGSIKESLVDAIRISRFNFTFPVLRAVPRASNF